MNLVSNLFLVSLFCFVNSSFGYCIVDKIQPRRTTPRLKLRTSFGNSNIIHCMRRDWRRPTLLFLRTENDEEVDEADKNNDKRGRLAALSQRVANLPLPLRFISSFLTRMQQKVTKDLKIIQGKGVAKKGNVENAKPETPAPPHISTRSSTAADHVDLSGTWRPIVTPDFKKSYDQYLLNCSQSLMFRKVIVNGLSFQKEIIRQLEHGKDLEIMATNPAGNWNRTLVASSLLDPQNATITDPDGDSVQVEAWWEQQGTVHKSWLRGKPRVRGGAFETARYLESDDVLVCESSFHPSPSARPSEKFRYGHVVWKFQRES